jgi:hypothetical protein
MNPMLKFPLAKRLWTMEEGKPFMSEQTRPVAATGIATKLLTMLPPCTTTDTEHARE